MVTRSTGVSTPSTIVKYDSLGNITANLLKSTRTNGYQPFEVSSSTQVNNLRAQYSSTVYCGVSVITGRLTNSFCIDKLRLA